MPILAIDPIAFRLLGWPVHWYGLLIGLGMVLSYLLVMREGRRKGLSEDYLSDAYFWTIIIGLIGARAYYVLFRLDYYLAHPDHHYLCGKALSARPDPDLGCGSARHYVGPSYRALG